MPLTKVAIIALAAVLALGASDTALASGQKRQVEGHSAPTLPLDANGVPIIMQDLERPKKTVPEKRSPKGRVERPRKLPRGSSTYIPPPVPSPYTKPPPPLTQPTEVYKPPPIKSFGDRVIECIHSYPLNKGIGNNPTDQQMYIRQCANGH